MIFKVTIYIEASDYADVERMISDGTQRDNQRGVAEIKRVKLPWEEDE